MSRAKGLSSDNITKREWIPKSRSGGKQKTRAIPGQSENSTPAANDLGAKRPRVDDGSLGADLAISESIDNQLEDDEMDGRVAQTAKSTVSSHFICLKIYFSPEE